MSFVGTERTRTSVGPTASPRPDAARRVAGTLALAIAGAAAAIWLGWRLTHLDLHPVAGAVLICEFVSLAGGLTVGVGLLHVTPGSAHARPLDRRDAFRFASAVGELLGRGAVSDVHGELRTACRSAWRTRGGGAELTMLAVLLDGPRRLLLVVSLVAALLLGAAPMPVPPWWAIGCGLLALVSLSSAHVLLGSGRIRVGDRIRWSSSALGEVFSGADRADLAPRYWVGTVAAVVSLNLAVALRGMSDRWTHGLAPMSSDGRVLTMLLAIVVVLGGLYTLQTTAPPQLVNGHLAARRIEERTARRSAVGAAILVGAIGLAAGLAPADSPSGRDGLERVVRASPQPGARVTGPAIVCDRPAVAADRASIPANAVGDTTLGTMATVRLFAAARDAAGTGRDVLPGDTVAEVLTVARQRYGQVFASVLASSKVWVNGEPAHVDDRVGVSDEVAILPPVSGGCP